MSEKTRILIVCQHFWPETFRINDIAAFFVEKDIEVDVLCGIPNYPKGRYYKGYSLLKNRRQTHNKINIRRTLEIPRGNNSNIRIFINYVSFPIASIFHIPSLLTKKYDKILIYQLSPVMMSIAGILLGKIKKIETTMCILDLWPENLYSVLQLENRQARWTIKKISHWHYRNVDKLVVLSDAMKQRVENIAGVSNKKIIVLPQACEKIYEQDLVDKNLQKRFSQGFNILFTGNISPAQSFETIIDAANIIKNAGYSDINWIIVGDGMSKAAIEKQVAKANLNEIFYFEGQKPVEDIPKYTHIADLLIGCLVKSELLEATIPAKVMSYIAAGKPIALAMDGEVQNLINNKIKCGIATNTDDPAALASSITTIYRLNRAARKQMGDRARAYHMKNFERYIILSKLHHFIFD
ncbi:glycosyltransferase WbuB [bacterium]|nr:glycosyltransferase WbuB [bacterium]NBX98008.1 glycosyltransferase WbuB [bacterium]NDC95509.1 glycosyltransferase WbuB [bacterium]NDD84973.1 glycosyltransferase WbuB [bacterium]NDG30169.1 glycosyltransferase WbuB [bacterium]